MYVFQFDLLWSLRDHGPVSAAELAMLHKRKGISWDAVQIAGSLRPLVQRGFVSAATTGGPNLYDLTEKGQRYVDA